MASASKRSVAGTQPDCVKVSVACAESCEGNPCGGIQSTVPAPPFAATTEPLAVVLPQSLAWFEMAPSWTPHPDGKVSAMALNESGLARTNRVHVPRLESALKTKSRS